MIKPVIKAVIEERKFELFQKWTRAIKLLAIALSVFFNRGPLLSLETRSFLRSKFRQNGIG